MHRKLKKNLSMEPKTCQKGPKVESEYWPTFKTSHCVRTACMAFPKTRRNRPCPTCPNPSKATYPQWPYSPPQLDHDRVPWRPSSVASVEPGWKLHLWVFHRGVRSAFWTSPFQQGFLDQSLKQATEGGWEGGGGVWAPQHIYLKIIPTTRRPPSGEKIFGKKFRFGRVAAHL